MKEFYVFCTLQERNLEFIKLIYFIYFVFVLIILLYRTVLYLLFFNVYKIKIISSVFQVLNLPRSIKLEIHKISVNWEIISFSSFFPFPSNLYTLFSLTPFSLSLHLPIHNACYRAHLLQEVITHARLHKVFLLKSHFNLLALLVAAAFQLLNRRKVSLPVSGKLCQMQLH